MSNPTTLFDFFTDQDFINGVDKFNCVRTSVLRYYLTAETGKRIKTNRFDEEQLKKQIEKLKRVEVDSSFNIKTHLEMIEEGGLMYGKTKVQMKSHVSYGRRFFEYVAKRVIPVDKDGINKKNKNDILSYTEAIMDKSEFVHQSKGNGQKVTIVNDPNFYLAELKDKYPSYSDEKIFQVSTSVLNNIFKVIESYKKYRSVGKKKCGKRTCNNDIEVILRFIGWYKEYHNLTIDEVKIDSIFPIINPHQYSLEYNPNGLSDLQFASIARKEWELRAKIKSLSRKFRKNSEEYLYYHLDKIKNSTRKTYIQTLINFAHFLYKDITDTEENDDFQDISLVKTMRVITRDISASNKQDKKDEEAKIIPFVWSEIEAVCERLRKEANQDYNYYKAKKHNKGNKLTKRKKAIHIQNFLAIAFFCVMPPDRQRTFRELTFGKTLKYGIKEGQKFIPYNKLKPEEEPKYYIHLLPSQYKTGGTYGTYWHEIKNVKYEDGKRFYDYLNQWLFNGYRDELVKGKKTNAVFIKMTIGVSFVDEKDSQSDFCSFIKNIFKCKTKFPLNPHALRNIYITEINNRGLSEETRRAIAYMMHHDLDTANQTYNKQTLSEKMRLAEEYYSQRSGI